MGKNKNMKDKKMNSFSKIFDIDVRRFIKYEI